MMVLFWRFVCAAAVVQAQDAITKHTEAEKIIREVTEKLRAAPQKADLWHARAKARMEMDDPLGAISDASEAVRLAPFEPDYRFTRASLLVAQARWAEVVADATDGLPANPNRADLLLYPAQARRNMGKHELALMDCNRALGAGVTADALVERAWVFAMKGDWAKTLEDATNATKAKPNWMPAVLLQGVARR